MKTAREWAAAAWHPQGATLDRLEEHFVEAMADVRRSALEDAAKVFADFKTTPTDTEGWMRTTQEEVARVTAKFVALLDDTTNRT